MQKAFQKDMDEDDARSTVEIQALNKEKPKVSTADLDDLSSNGKDVFANTKVMDANTQASVKNTFKAFGKIAKTNLEEDAKAKLEHKLKQKELNKQLNKDTMMFLEISQRITKLSNFKIGGMNKIVDPGKYSKRRRSNVAVIIVRIVFISSFLFYCLLLNHSFKNNPNNITNCFKLFSL